MGPFMMRMIVSRLIAMLILAVPFVLAAYGFLEIKDAVFHYMVKVGEQQENPEMDWGSLVLGIILFLGGAGFVGGWIFYRDRKRNYVAPRFKEKKKGQRG